MNVWIYNLRTFVEGGGQKHTRCQNTVVCVVIQVA